MSGVPGGPAAASPRPALELIKRYIVERQMRPGDKLPAERDLAADLGVSRHCVREALGSLQALGVLEMRQGSGNYLREQDFAFLSFPMKMALRQGERTIADLIEARELVETQVIRLACERCTGRQLDQLEDFMRERSLPESRQCYEGKFDFEFETLLGDLCGNQYLSAIQRLTHRLWEDALRSLDFQPVGVDTILAEHAAVLDALRRRDAGEARESMLYHLRSAMRIYLDKSQNKEEPRQ